MSERPLVEYRPRWAPNVLGTYEERANDPETGEHLEQRIALKCETCGDEHRATCTTGQARKHVDSYALAHVHRDPLKTPPPRPGQ